MRWRRSVRARVRGLGSFSTLSGDQSYKVLRPLAKATDETTEEAITPTLAALREPFLARLRQAERQAQEILDEFIAEIEDILVVPVDLGLTHREVATEAQVEALVNEIRAKLMAQLGDDKRIRIK